MSHGGESPFGVRHLEGLFGWLGKYGVNTGIVATVFGLLILVYLFFTLDVGTNRVVSFIIASSPLWLPYILFYLFFESWMFYIQTFNRFKGGRVSLEIMLPKDVFKSPAAMESILSQLFQKASPDNLYETYWLGKHPPYYSLEVISTEGQVRFVVSTQNNKYKAYVENAFYSQYPGIEIREMPVDYTAAVPWDPKNWGYMPIHFGKKNIGDKMGYPIMTYVDFGLDKDPKEEFKHSPVSQLVELLGSLGPGEHMWFQFLIKIHREETFETGALGTIPDWRGGIKKEIKEIIDEARKRSVGEEDEDNTRGSVMLTPMERANIEALERAIAKWPFKVHMRVYYAAKLENIDYDRIGQAITIFQATEHHSRNSIRYKWRADYDYNWWQDPSGRKRMHHKKEELEQYKLRWFEAKNQRDVGSIMTTEEIATLFHLPGAVVTTPSLARIPSARAEAPVNLPTG